jgi:hypothetical protein
MAAMDVFLQNLRRIFNTSRNTGEKTSVIISCIMKEPALFHLTAPSLGRGATPDERTVCQIRRKKS